jgi:hypothetical protein
VKTRTVYAKVLLYPSGQYDVWAGITPAAWVGATADEGAVIHRISVILPLPPELSVHKAVGLGRVDPEDDDAEPPWDPPDPA